MVTAVLGLTATCSSLDTDRTVEPYSSFGAAISREACQHVAYTGQLEQKQAGLRDTVDVAGTLGRSVCVDGSPAPADAPTDPFFTNAQIVGDAASLNLTLPLILRLGFEWRPLRALRIELGADYEAWSMQKSITITPHDIYLEGVPGIGRYYLNPLQVVRDMQDSVAVHLGGEWDALPRRLTVRLGYLFESSATPDETLSVLTSDGLKNMVTLGLSIRVKTVWLDAGYGHIFYLDRDVTSSRSLQLNPIQPTLAVAVGNGSYSFATDVLAVGLRVQL